MQKGINPVLVEIGCIELLLFNAHLPCHNGGQTCVTELDLNYVFM